MDAESLVYMKENTQKDIYSIYTKGRKDEVDKWWLGPEGREELEVIVHKLGASVGGYLCMKIN